MNKILNKATNFRLVRIVAFLLGLLWAGGQVNAQQATMVNIFREGFDRPEFSSGYIQSEPSGFDFYDFTYASTPTPDDNECIITTNANLNGFSESVADHSGSGYYLYARKEDGTDSKKIYAVKNVDVTKGEFITFGVFYRAFDNGYNFEIQATGTGLGGETITTGNLPSAEAEWIPYYFTVKATSGGTITFSIVDRYGYYDAHHTFGIDDITVSKKAINITNPASLVTRQIPGEAVPLTATYNNPYQNGTSSYQWEKYNGSSWTAATAKTGTAAKAGTGNSFTTDAFSVTESTEGFVNYRLAVTVGGETFYSDIITVEYTSNQYVFREDFGGNWVSTDQTSASGPSADWWIKTGYQPDITTDFTYGKPDNLIFDNRDKAEIAYGQTPIKLDEDGAATYAITKLAGWNLPLPGYSDNLVWKWADYNGSKSFDDHTLPGDNSRGYFMYAANRTNTEKIVYEAVVPVTADMLGRTFSFSAWQVAIWGKEDKFSYQFKLEVINAAGDEIKVAEYKVSDEWEERILSFAIPNNYAGSAIKIRISSLGENLWLGLDDISLTEYDSYVTITSPSSGSKVASNVELMVNYDYVSSLTRYKWQERASDSGPWTDIPGQEGTVSGASGTFWTTLCSIQDNYYYRISITDAADTDFACAIYSDPVQLILDHGYLFKEDFGGTSLSTNSTKDWWISAPQAQAAFLQQRYKSDYEYAPDVDWFNPEDIANHPHGMDKTLYLYGDRFAITKVSGCMADLEESNQIIIPDQKKEMYDHTTGNGTGYYLMSRGQDDKTIYSHTLSCLPAGNYAFNVWLAGTSTDWTTEARITIQVTVGGDTYKQMVLITNQNWMEYSVPFYTDGTSVEISLISERGYKRRATFAVDDLTITNLSPRITAPAESETSIMEGTSATVYGEYKYVGILGSTVTYEWETSTNGTDWTKTGISGSASNVDGGKDAAVIRPTYTTGVIDNFMYYRLVVSGNGITLASEPVKITAVEWPKSKTYWICPDKITDDEVATIGYLPSLIYLRVEGGMYNVIYKWYREEVGGSLTLLEDGDEYKNDQATEGHFDFTLESDGKTNTISVQNENNIDGVFAERTYWVEICDVEGNAIAGVDKVPIYLKQGYICGEPVPVISPATARRLHRENFGGTEAGTPEQSQTPLPSMTYTFQKSFNTSDGVEQGSYVVVKKLNGQGIVGENIGWYKGTQDHLYDIPDENPHGYLVAIDGNENRGVFYSHTIRDLGACRDVELVFTGWLASPMGWWGTDKASLKFTLTDEDTKAVLSEYHTGNLLDRDGHEEGGIDKVATWRQYGLRFPVPSGVNAINLTITNNNFGTKGGNDIIMDDIEIYLVIPPVKLVPEGNSFVCPDYTTVSLKGEYEDDGTLGNFLDYRWERLDPVSGTWTVIPEQCGSVSSGMVTSTKSEYLIDSFTEAHNGSYRLVVGQAGAFGVDYTETPNYDCVAISNPRTLTLISRSDEVYRPSLEGLTAYCYDDLISIENTEQNPDVTKYYQYTWQLDGDILYESAENNEDIVPRIKLNAADYAPGFHTLALIVSNSAGCSYYSLHQFVIYPEKTTWTANGDPKNWNDKDNWDNGVPGDCTDVIIPHKTMEISTGVKLLNHYPLLIKPTVETLNGILDGGLYQTDQDNLENQKEHINNDEFSLRPACDTIFFRMGGEVARTNYLKYNFAYVDLDIKPRRWYTLSAPLRDMYSGDYFVEGNVKRMSPTVYMMKYNAINPQTQEVPLVKIAGDFSNPFNTLTEELYPGLGYAVWVDDGDKAIEELQPFRFPKDDLQYEMWNYHGVSLGMTKNGLIKRDNMGRFTYEQLPTLTSDGFEVEVKGDNDSYSTVLVGNPFMSHLDFSAFMAENPSLTGGYYIWTTGDTYEAILPGDFSDTPNAIAPMQSFIVEKKSASVISSLKFKFDMSITSPDAPNGITLRSLSANNNILKMEVLRDNIVNSNIRIKYSPSSDNTYDSRKDMWTLFSKDNTSPAVLYALLDGKAASIRTLGDLSKPIELGIRTDTWGPLTLRLSGMETFDPNCDLYLEDRLTQTMQNLREYPEYTFDNRTGNIQGRFFLRIGNSATWVEDIISGTDIRIYEQNGKIIVNSSVDDPIETIKLYSVIGNLLYEKQAIKQHSISVEAPVSSQIIIVSVTTRTQKMNGKVMIQNKE